MDKTHTDDLNNVIKRCGYTTDNFRIVETDTTDWKPNEIAVIRGIVTITLISTNKMKEYRTGNNTSWIIEFESDLKNGVFS